MNHTELRTSYLRHQKMLSGIRRSVESGEENVYSGNAEMWKSYFSDRAHSAQFDELTWFLNDKNTNTLGVALKVPPGKRQLTVDYYSEWIAPETSEQHPLSKVGCPSVVEFRGQPENAAHLDNLTKMATLKHALRTAGRKTEGLRVAEIGAGYGGLASLLLESGLAASYTVIDLPQNLALSSYYLSEQFPDLAHTPLEARSALPNFDSGCFYLTPNSIDCLGQAEFDLVINTESLGEMPRETARSYVQWIQQHLSEAGVFFSKNGHSRGEGTLDLPSEYGYQAFDLLFFEPDRVANGPFHSQHHVFLLGRRSSESLTLDWRDLDLICQMIDLGIHDELLVVCEQARTLSFGPQEKKFVDCARDLFSSVNDSVARSFPTDYEDSNLSLAAQYLKAFFLILHGREREGLEAMRLYLQGAKSPVAEALGRFLCGVLSGESLIESEPRCGVRTRFLEYDFQSYVKRGWAVRQAYYQLRKEVLWRKVRTNAHYKPSVLMSLKNLAFNLKEKKSLSLARH